MLSLDPFASINPLNEAMINVTVITTADADMESFVTPKEIYLPDLQNEWGLDDAGESF